MQHPTISGERAAGGVNRSYSLFGEFCREGVYFLGQPEMMRGANRMDDG
jgi:hypothetical protein